MSTRCSCRLADHVSKGDQLHSNVPKGTRTTSFGVLDSQFSSAPEYCCLLPARAYESYTGPSSLHGILWEWRPRSADQAAQAQQSIRRGRICVEHLCSIGYRLVSLPLWYGSSRVQGQDHGWRSRNKAHANGGEAPDYDFAPGPQAREW